MKRRNEQKYVILLMLGITFPKDFPKRPLLILVFSQVATSQQCNFPKRQLPYCAISQVATSQLCNFPSGNFPSMQFPKLQLPNCAISQVATSQLCNFPSGNFPTVQFPQAATSPDCPRRSTRPPIALCGAMGGRLT